MAKLVAVCRDEEFPFERRQIPLMIEETLTMVMEIPETLISTECVDEADVKHFIKRYDLLTSDELICALMVSQKELFSLLAVSVPCVGCRRSVERLYSQLLESGQPALEPLIIKSSRVLTLSKSFLLDPRLIYALFYIHGSHLNDMVDTIPKSRRNRRCVLHSMETHKTRSLGWMDVWDLLSQECRDEVVLIDSDSLLETLENYLRKHRFCSECKSKVIKAYNILSGDIEGDPDKGYCATLYEGLKSCPKERHIHVLCDTDFIAHLIDRAEPELAGGRRERHARTIEIAQEEVLTCLGIHLWERLHRLWQKLRAEEQTWQMLFYLGVEALRKSFEVAVEDKQGISRLEQVVEEISEAERAKELKKEHKRLKRKKRKENKCKFANENEKRDLLLSNGDEETGAGKENESENTQAFNQESLSSRKCTDEENVDDGSENNCDFENSGENSCSNENFQSIETSSCKDKISKTDKGMKFSNEEENCKCGDEKSNVHWQNGFISLPEEKPLQTRQHSSKKQKRIQSNGFISPPLCSFCGQSISLQGKYDRGASNRSKDVSEYTEICAKCSSLNSDVIGKRSKKKFGRHKDLKDHESLNSRQRNEKKTPTKMENRPDLVHRSSYDNDNDDAELKLLKSMGWNSSERGHIEDSGQIAFADDAFISEQELKEFQAKKKDLQSQREELREKLRQQFQTMCIKPTCHCVKPINGIKINK